MEVTEVTFFCRFPTRPRLQRGKMEFYMATTAPEIENFSKRLRYGAHVIDPHLDDITLAVAYMRLFEEDLLKVVWYQGVPTLKDFLATHTDGRTVLGCFYHEEDAPPNSAVLCGLGWVGHKSVMHGYSKAETGMVFFHKNIPDKAKKSRELFGKLMLKYFFDHNDIDCLFGTTPEPNRLALKYAQKLGFSLHGPIPDFVTWQGQPTAAWVSHLSKAEWLERGR